MLYRFTMPFVIETEAGPAIVAEADYRAEIGDAGHPGVLQWHVTDICVFDVSGPHQLEGGTPFYGEGAEARWKRLVPGGQFYALALSHLMTNKADEITWDFNNNRDLFGDAADAIYERSK